MTALEQLVVEQLGLMSLYVMSEQVNLNDTIENQVP